MCPTPTVEFPSEYERPGLPFTVDASSGLRRASELVHTLPSIPKPDSTLLSIIPMSADSPSVPVSIHVGSPSAPADTLPIPSILNFGASQTAHHSFCTRPPRRAPSPIVTNHSCTIPVVKTSPPVSDRDPECVDSPSAQTDLASTLPESGIEFSNPSGDPKCAESASVCAGLPPNDNEASGSPIASESVRMPSTLSLFKPSGSRSACNLISTPSTSEMCSTPRIVGSASPESPGFRKRASTLHKMIPQIAVTPSAHVSRHSIPRSPGWIYSSLIL